MSWLIDGKSVEDCVNELAETNRVFVQVKEHVNIFNKWSILENVLQKENINTKEKLINRYKRWPY